MGKQLTARQREVFDAIRSYSIEKGYPPSIRELRPILGISSLRGVTIHLDALERKGWIQRESTSRSIRLLAPMPDSPAMTPLASIPLLGNISAGLPLLAVENVESYVSVPTGFAGESDDMFALKVRGDSMIGDHILDGDTIIVRSRNAAEHGDIVVALVDDEVTVKRLGPENEKLRILGVVVGLTRSYEPIRGG
ncbi:MAG: transcriptional repressor LexA [Armatimonadota bacterium]